MKPLKDFTSAIKFRISKAFQTTEVWLFLILKQIKQKNLLTYQSPEGVPGLHGETWVSLSQSFPLILDCLKSMQFPAYISYLTE